MAQCVCGQYSQPGDVQCRYCGRPLDVYSAAPAPYDAYNASPPSYDNFAGEAQYDPNFAYKPAPLPQQHPTKSPAYPPASGQYPASQDMQNRAPAAPPLNMPMRQEPKPPRATVAQDSAEQRQFMTDARAMLNSIKRFTLINMIVLIIFAVLFAGAALWGLQIFTTFLDALKEVFVLQ